MDDCGDKQIFHAKNLYYNKSWKYEYKDMNFTRELPIGIQKFEILRRNGCICLVMHNYNL